MNLKGPRDTWGENTALLYLKNNMSLKNVPLQTDCDKVLDDIYSQLLTLQDKYKDEDIIKDLGVDDNPITKIYQRGKYFQLLDTHSVIPKDNVTTVPDVENKTPTDQRETYTDFGLVLPAKMPCSISISPYQDNRGWGFNLIGKVIDGEDTYIKVRNYGHLTDRERDWEILV